MGEKGGIPLGFDKVLIGNTKNVKPSMKRDVKHKRKNLTETNTNIILQIYNITDKFRYFLFVQIFCNLIGERERVGTRMS